MFGRGEIMVFLGINESTFWFMLFQSVSLVNVIPPLRMRSPNLFRKNKYESDSKMGDHAMDEVVFSKINAVLSETHRRSSQPFPKDNPIECCTPHALICKPQLLIKQVSQ